MPSRPPSTARRRTLVLMLHGFGEFWWSWRHQLTSLTEAGYRAVAVDLRGYGDSDKPPRGYDGWTLAGDTNGPIRSLGHSNATLVGHADGGLVLGHGGVAPARVVSRIAVVASPHPIALRRAKLRNKDQRDAFSAIPSTSSCHDLASEHDEEQRRLPPGLLPRPCRCALERVVMEFDEVLARKSRGHPDPRRRPLHAGVPAMGIPVPVPPGRHAVHGSDGHPAGRPGPVALRGRDDSPTSPTRRWRPAVTGLRDSTIGRCRGAGHFVHEEQPGRTAKLPAGLAREGRLTQPDTHAPVGTAASDSPPWAE